MIEIGKHVINTRYIRYFYLDQDETNTNEYQLVIELAGGDTMEHKDNIKFHFKSHKDALKVHAYLKRKMNG